MIKGKETYDRLNSNLCIGCGTCISMCPKNLIELKLDTNRGVYIPKLNEKDCIDCKICLKVCPAHDAYKEISKLDDFRQINSSDQHIGKYFNCYSGHSTDFNIRYNSASGGLVTSILIYALETGYINGALVTQMNQSKPLEPEPFIARSREEIIKAKGSKYCPVPVNTKLIEILNSEEDEKFAVVGLPCHISAIRKAEKINKKLKDKIVLHISIFCSGTPNFKATDFLINNLNEKKEEVISLDYRGKGWPGKMTLKLKNKKTKEFPYPEYWQGFGNLFYPPRCKICIDWFAKNADISLGDSWLAEKKSDKAGESLIIVRNLIGENIIKKMEEKRSLELSSVSIRKVYLSQIGYTKRRKYLTIHQNLARLLRRKLPYHSNNIKVKTSIFDYILFFNLNFMSYLATKKKLWRCLKIYSLLLNKGIHLRSKLL